MSGLEQKKGDLSCVPAFDRGKRRDVLFFTQELSTLLSAGIPLDRAIAITAELTDRADSESLVMDVLRVLKSGKSLADSLATRPDVFPSCTSIWFAPAKLQVRSRRFSKGWPNSSIPRRSARVHHQLHDLSGPVDPGRHRLDFRAAEFRGAALCVDFFRSADENSYADGIMLDASRIVQN